MANSLKIFLLGSLTFPGALGQVAPIRTQRIRDAKLGAPVVARALAIVHTCMYDAWAAYDERAIGYFDGVIENQVPMTASSQAMAGPEVESKH